MTDDQRRSLYEAEKLLWEAIERLTEARLAPDDAAAYEHLLAAQRAGRGGLYVAERVALALDDVLRAARLDGPWME